MQFQIVESQQPQLDAELLNKFDAMSAEERDDFEALLDQLLDEKKTNLVLAGRCPTSRASPV